MKPPSAIELLDLWDDGRAVTPAQRALALLTAAYPGVSTDARAALPIGQRDAELLRLREVLFGRRMAAIAACESCRRNLELALDTQELLANAPLDRALPTELHLELYGYVLRFRLPTTIDLLAVEAAGDSQEPRAVLFDRCLLSASQQDSAIASRDLPEPVVSGIGEAMAEADPLADIQLKLNCPACGHVWRAAFDIVSFLWIELDAWARRTLAEVHVLARAYGWSEREIVALSPNRRRYYLEMVGA